MTSWRRDPRPAAAPHAAPLELLPADWVPPVDPSVAWMRHEGLDLPGRVDAWVGELGLAPGSRGPDGRFPHPADWDAARAQLSLYCQLGLFERLGDHARGAYRKGFDQIGAMFWWGQDFRLFRGIPDPLLGPDGTWLTPMTERLGAGRVDRCRNPILATLVGMAAVRRTHREAGGRSRRAA